MDSSGPRDVRDPPSASGTQRPQDFTTSRVEMSDPLTSQRPTTLIPSTGTMNLQGPVTSATNRAPTNGVNMPPRQTPGILPPNQYPATSVSTANPAINTAGSILNQRTTTSSTPNNAEQANVSSQPSVAVPGPSINNTTHRSSLEGLDGAAPNLGPSNIRPSQRTMVIQQLGLMASSSNTRGQPSLPVLTAFPQSVVASSQVSTSQTSTKKAATLARSANEPSDSQLRAFESGLSDGDLRILEEFEGKRRFGIRIPMEVAQLKKVVESIKSDLRKSTHWSIFIQDKYPGQPPLRGIPNQKEPSRADQMASGTIGSHSQLDSHEEEHSSNSNNPHASIESEALVDQEEQQAPKNRRGPGRPPGAKNKPKNAVLLLAPAMTLPRSNATVYTSQHPPLTGLPNQLALPPPNSSFVGTEQPGPGAGIQAVGRPGYIDQGTRTGAGITSEALIMDNPPRLGRIRVNVLFRCVNSDTRLLPGIQIARGVVLIKNPITFGGLRKGIGALGRNPSDHQGIYTTLMSHHCNLSDWGLYVQWVDQGHRELFSIPSEAEFESAYRRGLLSEGTFTAIYIASVPTQVQSGDAGSVQVNNCNGSQVNSLPAQPQIPRHGIGSTQTSNPPRALLPGPSMTQPSNTTLGRLLPTPPILPPLDLQHLSQLPQPRSAIFEHRVNLLRDQLFTNMYRYIRPRLNVTFRVIDPDNPVRPGSHMTEGVVMMTTVPYTFGAVRNAIDALANDPSNDQNVNATLRLNRCVPQPWGLSVLYIHHGFLHWLPIDSHDDLVSAHDRGLLVDGRGCLTAMYFTCLQAELEGSVYASMEVGDLGESQLQPQPQPQHPNHQHGNENTAPDLGGRRFHVSEQQHDGDEEPRSSLSAQPNLQQNTESTVSALYGQHFQVDNDSAPSPAASNTHHSTESMPSLDEQQPQVDSSPMPVLSNPEEIPQIIESTRDEQHIQVHSSHVPAQPPSRHIAAVVEPRATRLSIRLAEHRPRSSETVTNNTDRSLPNQGSQVNGTSSIRSPPLTQPPQDNATSSMVPQPNRLPPVNPVIYGRPCPDLARSYHELEKAYAKATEHDMDSPWGHKASSLTMEKRGYDFLARRARLMLGLPGPDVQSGGQTDTETDSSSVAHPVALDAAGERGGQSKRKAKSLTTSLQKRKRTRRI